MDIQTGILLGIAAMVCWGTADIFAKRVIDKIGVFKTLLTTMSASIPFLLIFSLFFTDIFYLPPNPLLITITALIDITGFVFFYKAIEKGKISIASPIGYSHGMIVVLLGVFFLHEVLTKFQFFSIAAIILGVIMISTKFSELRALKIKGTADVGYALISMLMWGLSIFLIAIITRSFEFILTVLWFRILGVIFTIMFGALKKEKLFFPVGNLWVPIILAAVFDTAGLLAFTSAVLTNLVSLITPIASASPAVTILLARLFYKERLEFNQKIAALLILVGVISLSI